jgi:hypothetical protein
MGMARTAATVAFAVFAAGRVAADGGGQSADACGLLSVNDIAAVIGKTVAAGEPHDSGRTKDGAYSSTCLWKAAVTASTDPDAPLGGAGFAILNTMVWPSGSGRARQYLEDFRKAATAHEIDMVPVPVEAGDEALWWGDGVAVAKGDVSFGVSVHLDQDKAAEQAMEENLARRVAGKL